MRHLRVEAGLWFYMNHLTGQTDTAAHDHNCLELAFILGGRARHYTVDGPQSCRPGDVYIIPLGAWHGYAACRQLELINCLFSPGLLSRELAWLAEDEVMRSLLGLDTPRGCGGVRRLALRPKRRKPMGDCLAGLWEAYRRGASRLELVGRILILLEHVRQAAEASGVHALGEPAGHPSVRRAMDLLQRDPSTDWTLTRLARALPLNPSYLVRLFRRHTGLAPMKYLARLRAERAATLLLSTRLRIGEVAARVGWPEPKQFARSFHQHFGVSASAYRQTMLRPFADCRALPVIVEDAEPASGDGFQLL